MGFVGRYAQKVEKFKFSIDKSKSLSYNNGICLKGNEAVMKLELIGIISNNGATLKFEDDLTFAEAEFLGEVYEFEGPLHVIGKIENISGSLLLAAEVVGSMKSFCARCGKQISVPLKYEISETVATEEDETDDAILLEGTVLDVDEVVLKGFYVNVPTKNLCSADCKGLCQKCGANKNEQECGCDVDVIDPRLAVIDDLFKD